MVHIVTYCPTSGFSLNLVSLDIRSRGFFDTMAIIQEKQQKTVFEIECSFYLMDPLDLISVSEISVKFPIQVV